MPDRIIGCNTGVLCYTLPHSPEKGDFITFIPFQEIRSGEIISDCRIVDDRNLLFCELRIHFDFNVNPLHKFVSECVGIDSPFSTL